VYDEHEALVIDVAHEARAGDTVVIMSNGGFAGVHQRLLDALRRSPRPEKL
jgi:UDP-N-acetylmuramate: L-alanyl-gamma-D-glutamyl-meso-diaminopimelate ligase